MSLYNVKKIPLIPALKIYSIILAIFAIVIAVIYFFAMKLSFADFEGVSMSYLFAISAGVILAYLIIGIIGTALFVWLYNLFASKLGGIEIELEAKE